MILDLVDNYPSLMTLTNNNICFLNIGLYIVSIYLLLNTERLLIGSRPIERRVSSSKRFVVPSVSLSSSSSWASSSLSS